MFEDKYEWEGIESSRHADPGGINLSSGVATVGLFRVVRGSNLRPDAHPGGKWQFPSFCFYCGSMVSDSLDLVFNQGVARQSERKRKQVFPGFPGNFPGVYGMGRGGNASAESGVQSADLGKARNSELRNHVTHPAPPSVAVMFGICRYSIGG